MPRRTDGEKVDELEKLAAGLVVRVDNLEKETNATYGGQTEHARLFADFRRETDRDIALLKQAVDDLKASRYRGAERVWTVVLSVVSGLVGALLLHLIGLKN